jgi:hypothetical protein
MKAKELYGGFSRHLFQITILNNKSQLQITNKLEISNRKTDFNAPVCRSSKHTAPYMPPIS